MPGDAAREEADLAVEQAELIVELIDDEVPEWAHDKAGEFFESVREGVTSLIETIRRKGYATAKQKSALDNWEAGVRKWIKD